MNLSDLLASDLIDHQIDLLRYASGTNRKVQALLAELQDDVVARLARSTQGNPVDTQGNPVDAQGNAQGNNLQNGGGAS